jgi:hypothetical protein
MKCPKCNFFQSDQNTKCLKCGILFENRQRHSASALRKASPTARGKGDDTEDGSFLQNVFFSVEPEVNVFYFGGRIIVALILFIWGWKFILTPMTTNEVGSSFLHLVNLPFHEAGHIFFRLFGRWMTSLGGTLGQLLIPIICLLTFLVKSKDPFGASVSLWWLGENFMDIAPYINDARNQELMLLGGVTGKEAEYGYHDWEFILNEIGLIRYDHTLAHLAYFFGIVLMLLSFVWAGYLLFKQYKHLQLT